LNKAFDKLHYYKISKEIVTNAAMKHENSVGLLDQAIEEIL